MDQLKSASQREENMEDEEVGFSFGIYEKRIKGVRYRLDGTASNMGSLRYLLDKAESSSYNKIKVATMTELKT